MALGLLLSRKRFFPRAAQGPHKVRTGSAQGQQWPSRPGWSGFGGGPIVIEHSQNLEDLHGLVGVVGVRVNFLYYGNNFLYYGRKFLHHRTIVFLTGAAFFTVGANLLRELYQCNFTGMTVFIMGSNLCSRGHFSFLRGQVSLYHLKGYALCRRLLLALRSCHLGSLVFPFWHFGRPFWLLGDVPGGHLRTPGPLWRTMGAAGWTQGGPEKDLHRFWSAFGTRVY